MFLTRKSLATAFSQFGVVKSLKHRRASDFGVVKFKNPGSVIDVFNKVLNVGECTIHTFHPINQLKSGETVPYQIMIKSKNLPKYWEKSILIKLFFQKFGEVTGVDFWSNRVVVISFKEVSVAEKLIGSKQSLLSHTYEVLGVSPK